MRWKVNHDSINQLTMQLCAPAALGAVAVRCQLDFADCRLSRAFAESDLSRFLPPIPGLQRGSWLLKWRRSSQRSCAATPPLPHESGGLR